MGVPKFPPEYEIKIFFGNKEASISSIQPGSFMALSVETPKFDLPTKVELHFVVIGPDAVYHKTSSERHSFGSCGPIVSDLPPFSDLQDLDCSCI